jgi:HSP20 family molecular chaperone IbpA
MQLKALLAAVEDDFDVFVEMPDCDYNVESIKIDYSEGTLVIAASVEEEYEDEVDPEEDADLPMTGNRLIPLEELSKDIVESASHLPVVKEV